jgi:hypothetical protein
MPVRKPVPPPKRAPGKLAAQKQLLKQQAQDKIIRDEGARDMLATAEGTARAVAEMEETRATLQLRDAAMAEHTALLEAAAAAALAAAKAVERLHEKRDRDQALQARLRRVSHAFNSHHGPGSPREERSAQPVTVRQTMHADIERRDQLIAELIAETGIDPAASAAEAAAPAAAASTARTTAASKKKAKRGYQPDETPTYEASGAVAKRRVRSSSLSLSLSKSQNSVSLPPVGKSGAPPREAAAAKPAAADAPRPLHIPAPPRMPLSHQLACAADGSFDPTISGVENFEDRLKERRAAQLKYEAEHAAWQAEADRRRAEHQAAGFEALELQRKVELLAKLQRMKAAHDRMLASEAARQQRLVDNNIGGDHAVLLGKKPALRALVERTAQHEHDELLRIDEVAQQRKQRVAMGDFHDELRQHNAVLDSAGIHKAVRYNTNSAKPPMNPIHSHAYQPVKKRLEPLSLTPSSTVSSELPGDEVKQPAASKVDTGRSVRKKEEAQKQRRAVIVTPDDHHAAGVMEESTSAGDDHVSRGATASEPAGDAAANDHHAAGVMEESASAGDDHVSRGATASEPAGDAAPNEIRSLRERQQQLEYEMLQTQLAVQQQQMAQLQLQIARSERASAVPPVS